ncbi:molybdenum cofactor sulfurase [Streptosporangium jomthongense]|uniref:MOSC domain-containing protein n=1 Tax=Marinobacter aromaticivorans TaxID=1494078 RepID=A0ABW2IQL1_9GAMM|nr:MOSC domain-containing protein [Marinobacter aromaticivorans]GGE54615.1 molybdenum cofactor sulfurase [Streptosporangium jomthongense]
MAKGVVIRQLRVGSLTRFADTGTLTGIYKQQVDSAYLNANGLSDDQQGDKTHHGGPEKALHHFASDHYEQLRKALPEPAAGRCQPGAFGENLVTEGLTETDVCVGDIFKLGEAIVQVSQPRQPCWRLNLRFGIPDMSRRLQSSLRTGWYYRVLQPGIVHRGDILTLEQRPNPEWPLSRILAILYDITLEPAALAGMVGLVQLSPNLRNIAKQRLATQQVENWEGRLFGSSPQKQDDATGP